MSETSFYIFVLLIKICIARPSFSLMTESKESFEREKEQDDETLFWG